MQHYLAELYLPRGDRHAVPDIADGACRAAEHLTREGTPVRCLHAIFVPEDETCFLLFEAGSLEAVQAATNHAALECLRIVEAIQASRSAGPPAVEEIL